MNYEPVYLGEIELSEETLEHYGIKGMKWRNRKGRKLPWNPNGQRHIDSDYYYEYDPKTGQKHKILNMDKLMKRGKWKPKKVEIGYSQVTRSGGSESSNRPRSRRRNVTGSGTGAYRKGSRLGYKVGRR